MIASLSAWFIILIVFSVLYAFWRLLDLVFWCIDYAQSSADRRSREAMSANREREQSDFS